MKFLSPIILIFSLLVFSAPEVKLLDKNKYSLKEAFRHKFAIGTAVNVIQMLAKRKKETSMIARHFSAITAESCMKSINIQPREDQFSFTDSDQFVTFGERNKIQVIGHTLIWHSQATKSFFIDKGGSQVSREVLIERMKKHILTELLTLRILPDKEQAAPRIA